MSANAWKTCPRCALRHKARAAEMLTKAMEAYGVVPLDDWMDMDAEAKKAAEPFAETTFREDWEIYGADDGTVTVSYGGGCGTCGLSASFKYEHPIAGIEA